MLESREDFIEAETTKKVNEKLRTVKRKDAGEVFGLEGNFRKLDID